MKNLLEIIVNDEKKSVHVGGVYCIGYAGRDVEKTMEHVIELEEIGVPRPPEIPMLYPVRTNSLNQIEEIEVLGNETSGEAEIVLVFGDSEDEAYITIGSDHTDRGLETVDINKSKQVCDKPIGKKAWKLQDVIGHWDELVLKAEVEITEGGEWVNYQNAPISSIISLEDIKAYLKKKGVPLTNSVVFSGTVPLLEGFKYGTGFRMTFVDPVRKDEIHGYYKVRNLERE
ncbi:DUF2848 family protein [Chungangia koreensis]|uniref:DUF2848 family protein n=1 Tax=Chungangia koreensis TaxID=752657 RepID=A0ABV8X499_9LACT